MYIYLPCLHKNFVNYKYFHRNGYENYEFIRIIRKQLKKKMIFHLGLRALYIVFHIFCSFMTLLIFSRHLISYASFQNEQYNCGERQMRSVLYHWCAIRNEIPSSYVTLSRINRWHQSRVKPDKLTAHIEMSSYVSYSLQLQQTRHGENREMLADLINFYEDPIPKRT